MEKSKNHGSRNLPLLLTQEEVSAVLGVTSRTIANYKAKGILPCMQIGRVVRYRYEDVLAFIEQFMIKPKNWD